MMLSREMRGVLFLALIATILCVVAPAPALARQEVTGVVAYTGTPSFEDTMASSQTTFASSDGITLAMFLYTDGLPWSSVTIQAYIFDHLGRLQRVETTSFSATFGGLWRLGASVSPGTLPAGQYRWLVAVIGSDGTTFASTLQPLVIQ